MAGLTHPSLMRAYRSLHHRGVTTTSLARDLGTSRAYVSRLMCGYNRRGHRWRRICELLTEQEREWLLDVPEKVDPHASIPRRPEPPPAVRIGPAQSINTSGLMIRKFNRWRQSS